MKFHLQMAQENMKNLIKIRLQFHYASSLIFVCQNEISLQFETDNKRI